MRQRLGGDVVFLSAAVSTAVVFGPLVVLDEYWPLGPRLLVWIGALSKLAFLLTAGIFAGRSARAFEPGNPMRPAWTLLAIALVAYVVAQACLVFYQLILATQEPFPSVADLFFIISLALMIPALVVVIHTYHRAGFVPRPAIDIGATGALATAFLLIPGGVLLRPLVGTADLDLTSALKLAYPVADFLLIVLCVVVLKIAWRLRGGRVSGVWTSLLFGFLAFAIGDIAFAYLSDTKSVRLEGLVDLMYLGAYVAIARGTFLQFKLLDS